MPQARAKWIRADELRYEQTASERDELALYVGELEQEVVELRRQLRALWRLSEYDAAYIASIARLEQEPGE